MKRKSRHKLLFLNENFYMLAHDCFLVEDVFTRITMHLFVTDMVWRLEANDSSSVNPFNIYETIWLLLYDKRGWNVTGYALMFISNQRLWAN
jgi:hypothetical protein